MSIFPSTSKNFVTAVLLAIGAMAISHTQAAILLSNSTFEAPTLPPWNASVPGNTIVTLSGSAQSPFTSGTQGVELKVNTGAASRPILSQTLASPVNEGLNLTFDFMSIGTYVGSDGVIMARIFDNLGNSNYIKFQGNSFISDTTSGVTGATFSSNVWYHVDLQIPALSLAQGGTGKAILTLTPFGGSPVQYAPFTWSMSGSGTNYVSFQFQTGLNANAGTDVYVDNAFLNTVPEPTVLGLFAIGVLVILRHRRNMPV